MEPSKPLSNDFLRETEGYLQQFLAKRSKQLLGLDGIIEDAEVERKLQVIDNTMACISKLRSLL